MHKPTKSNIATIVVVGTAVTAAVKLHKLHEDMYTRFPDLPQRTVRRAYNIFLLNALRGKYNALDLDSYTDEQMDELFLEIMLKQTNPNV